MELGLSRDWVRTSALFVAVGAALLGAMGTSGVAAQDDADRALARVSFDRGVARFDAGDLEGALDAFRNAYRLAPHPTVRVNMAHCYERLGRADEAIFHYQRFLEEAGDIHPAQRRQVMESIARLRGQEPPPPEAPTEPGPPPSVQPPPPVQVVEPAPQEPLATQPLDASAEDSSGPGFYLSTQVIASGAATGGVLLVSVITGLVALSAEGDFDDAVARSNDPTLTPGERAAARREGLDASDRAGTFAAITDVFLAATLVGVGVTAYFYLTQDEPSETYTTMAPVVTSDGAGVAFSGRF